MPPAKMCQSIAVIACAVILSAAVPVAATVGAVTRASQKLPLEDAVALNRVSAGVASQLNLADNFRTALHAEARQRGIALIGTSPDAAVSVSLQSLAWDIKAGNRVAVRLELDVYVRRGGERRSREVTYRSASARVDEWIADDGQAIRESLQAAMLGASELIWARILSR